MILPALLAAATTAGIIEAATVYYLRRKGYGKDG